MNAISIGCLVFMVFLVPPLAVILLPILLVATAFLLPALFIAGLSAGLLTALTGAWASAFDDWLHR